MLSKPMHRTVNLDGQTVHYWEYGDPSHPTIVMVHGFRGTHNGLQFIARELADFHIIIPDLPGFGESPLLKKEHSIDNYARVITAFVRKLGLQHYALLGHSFGSIVASAVAAEHPKELQRLILINPIAIAVLDSPRKFGTRLTFFYYWLGNKLPEQSARALLSSALIIRAMTWMLSKTTESDVYQLSAEQHALHFNRFHSRQQLMEAFQASVAHGVAEFAPAITIPVLMIAGGDDDVAPLDGQRAVVKKFERGKLEIIEEVGHLIHYEKSKEAAGLIRHFLNS